MAVSNRQPFFNTQQTIFFKKTGFVTGTQKSNSLLKKSYTPADLLER